MFRRRNRLTTPLLLSRLTSAAATISLRSHKTESKDLYKILRLEPNASQAEIKSAYFKLAKKFHPDVNGGAVEYTEYFKEISHAYRVLSESSSTRTSHIPPQPNVEQQQAEKRANWHKANQQRRKTFWETKEEDETFYHHKIKEQLSILMLATRRTVYGQFQFNQLDITIKLHNYNRHSPNAREKKEILQEYCALLEKIGLTIDYSKTKIDTIVILNKGSLKNIASLIENYVHRPGFRP